MCCRSAGGGLFQRVALRFQLCDLTSQAAKLFGICFSADLCPGTHLARWIQTHAPTDAARLHAHPDLWPLVRHSLHEPSQAVPPRAYILGCKLFSSPLISSLINTLSRCPRNRQQLRTPIEKFRWGSVDNGSGKRELTSARRWSWMLGRYLSWLCRGDFLQRLASSSR